MRPQGNEMLDSVNLMGIFCLGESSDRISTDLSCAEIFVCAVEPHGTADKGVSVPWRKVYEEMYFLADSLTSQVRGSTGRPWAAILQWAPCEKIVGQKQVLFFCRRQIRTISLRAIRKKSKEQ